MTKYNIHPHRDFTKNAVKKMILFSPAQAADINAAIVHGISKNFTCLVRDAVAYFLAKNSSHLNKKGTTEA